MSITQLAGYLTQTVAGHRYLPILKSRQGEMKALAELVDPVSTDLTPVIELIDVDFDDKADVDDGLRKLAGKVTKAWPAGRPRVIVDTFNVEVDTDTAETDGHGALIPRDPITPGLVQLLQEAQIRAVPVIRLSDQDAYVEQVEPLLHGVESGACLRIGGEDLDDTIVPLDSAVENLLGRYRLQPEEVDLLLDFGALMNDDAVALAARLARFVLPNLDKRSWRSFAIASGAFPVDLSEVSAFTVVALPRRDRVLWVRTSTLQLRHRLDYADYAVTHPRLQVGVAFAAPPQIRYATVDSWLVTKGRRQDRRGHSQFFDLCGRLRSERPSDIAPPEQSWGDQEFHTAADKAGTEASQPGNASTWRAIATSHHIAHVMHQFAIRGAL